MAGDREGDLALVLIVRPVSLPCSLETLQCGCGCSVSCATGLQAKEKTRQEQGKHREAGRFFMGHFLFLVSVTIG